MKPQITVQQIAHAMELIQSYGGIPPVDHAAEEMNCTLDEAQAALDAATCELKMRGCQ